jgi:TfoX/Sxy family transcriptional regulator of competence genes
MGRMARRPKLPSAPDEIRRISALLTEALLGRPDVRTRPMFGLRALYRGNLIFAMLPDKRAFERRHHFRFPDRKASTLAFLDKAYRQAVSVPGSA